MVINARVREAVTWYSQAYPLYARLAQAAANLAETALSTARVPFHSITWRAKSVASYKQKALARGFTDPRTCIHDMAGIRIITFVQSNADQACRIMEHLFDVLETEDKALLREAGSFGYRSVHFTARLRPEALQSPQYSEFAAMCLEVQVRTLLQHAWAEIEHDRNYKFAGSLPLELQHRFATLAAVLELADREFDAVARAIDDYAASVQAQRVLGPISPIS